VSAWSTHVHPKRVNLIQNGHHQLIECMSGAACPS